jgi:hypothetical protein
MRPGGATFRYQKDARRNAAKEVMIAHDVKLVIRQGVVT